MTEGLVKMFALFDARQRRALWIVVALSLLVGLVDLAGVASLLPFLAVLASPDLIEAQPRLALIQESLGFDTRQGFMLFLGACVFLLITSSVAMRAVTFYAITRFSRGVTFTLSNALLRRCLDRPYEWFLGRHSADLGRTILSEAAQVTNGTVAPTIRLFANGTVMVVLLIFLVSLQPVVTLTTGIVMAGLFGLVYLVLRRYLLRLGKKRRTASEQRFQVVQEALGGVKEVKLLGLEDVYTGAFSSPSWRLSRYGASVALIGEMPRYALEMITFGGIMVFVLWLLWAANGDLQAVLPVIGAFAYAGVRLTPMMQGIFQDITKIRFGGPTLNAVHAILATSSSEGAAPARPAQGLTLTDEVRLEGVRYRYPGADRDSLTGIDLSIPARSSVGIVGSSGAGKTTLVDVLLGLLRPQEGALVVDGLPVTEETRPAWQASIGYVPQSVFLTDDTIAANIAFGMPQDRIDMDRVREVGALAEMDDFVSRLPGGYDTRIGEAGLLLSGGQRQRIGIARALYRRPEVVVFDEAMSALDTITERSVMRSIASLKGRTTTIVITHRLSSITGCDQVVMIEGGRIVEQGAYAVLHARNETFRALAAEA